VYGVLSSTRKHDPGNCEKQNPSTRHSHNIIIIITIIVQHNNNIYNVLVALNGEAGHCNGPRSRNGLCNATFINNNDYHCHHPQSMTTITITYVMHAIGSCFSPFSPALRTVRSRTVYLPIRASRTRCLHTHGIDIVFL